MRSLLAILISGQIFSSVYAAELPPPNPEWTEKRQQAHNRQREKFKRMVEMCDQGWLQQCRYAAANLNTAAKAYDGSGRRSRSYPTDKDRAVEFYQLSLTYFEKACALSEDPATSTDCRRVKVSEKMIAKTANPQKFKREQLLEKERVRRVLNAVRTYINKDCSKLGLLLKPGSNETSITTAVLSSMTVENGFCVANNGLTKHSIGVAGLYDLKCSSESEASRECSFGIYVHCRVTSEFGDPSDNDKISRALCRASFPANYSGAGTFLAVDDGKALRAVRFQISIAP